MKELNEVLKERNDMYGPYGGQIDVRQSLIDIMERVYQDRVQEPMCARHKAYLWDVMNKLSRIAWSPDHEDSWRDLAGYATIILKDIQERRSDAGK